MESVDRMYQNVTKYQVAILRKKWCRCLISYMPEAVVNNAWQLHKICTDSDENSMNLLQYRRYISRTYLTKCGIPPYQGMPGRPQTTLHDIHFDGLQHWVVPQEKQTRCAHCHAKTMTRCEKCDTGLYVKCFKQYHIRYDAVRYHNCVKKLENNLILLSINMKTNAKSIVHTTDS